MSSGAQDKHSQLGHEHMPKIPERHGIIPGWLNISCGICSSSACPMQYLMHDIRKTLLSSCFSPQDLTYMSIMPFKCQNKHPLNAPRIRHRRAFKQITKNSQTYTAKFSLHVCCRPCGYITSPM